MKNTKNISRIVQIKQNHRRAVAALAAAAAVASALPALGGTTGSAVTISASGSTALKNWLVANTNTFTDIETDQSMSINGTSYPIGPPTGLGINEWADKNMGGSALVYQLAPKKFNNGVSVTGAVADQSSALRFEYHESGSVEGVLEMANDQIAPVTYVTQNIDRNPGSTGTGGTSFGNAVWVNYNQIGGKGSSIPFNTTTGADTNSGTDNYHLGNFYTGTQSFVLGGTAQAAFAPDGTNLNGGQNAVQLALSDAIPKQVFQAPSTVVTDSHSSQPWFRTPEDANYGTGNSKLAAGNLGTASSRQMYQTTDVLNMGASTVNPRSTAMPQATFGSDGGAGWNTGGLNNLNSQLAAVTATLFVANPGTGLTQVDRTDAQWLQLQGRLQNGASFNMTTRDVNSGTRNVAALETGIDPTWASGVNDSGNGNANDATSSQISVGPGIRFSNKTAGGNELRPTVQVARMAIGTLSINDASGSTVNTAPNPLRTLKYSDSTNGTSSPYVLANYYTITGTTDATANPGGNQYTIFQNEQFVTVKAPDANYNTANPDIQGDDAAGDVKALINNTLNSVSSITQSVSTGIAGQTTIAGSPAGGLLSQGYIIPQLMKERKNENGLNMAGLPSQIVPNDVADGATSRTAFNATLASSISSSSAVVTKLAMGDPSGITAGSGSVYGGSTIAGSAPGFIDQIKITAGPGTTPAAGNYLFGNFNQNGVRDFDAAVVEAQKAQAALESSGFGISALSSSGGSPNASTVATGIAPLDGMIGQTTNTAGATKGDLIVLGDYNGDGTFDGKDLYAMAFGASLTDSAHMPSGTPGTISFHTGTMATSTAASFGADVAGAVLNKNAALDYLNGVGTTAQKKEARVTFTVTTGSATPTYAGVNATLVATNVSGNDAYTLDDTNGDNAFNKADVNHDGQINLDDALIVDKFVGQSYNSQDQQQTATIDVNGTINPDPANQKPISLVAATLVDYGSNSTATNKIQQGDADVVSKALNGSFNYAWYNGETKVGTLAISLAPAAGSHFQVPAGATFTISAGAVNVGKTVTAGVATTVANTVDPFTDSTAANTLDTSKSLAVTVGAAMLDYAARTGGAGDTGIKLDRLGSLTVQNGGAVTLDNSASHGDRTLLVTGSNLSFTGTGTLDIGANDLVIHNGTPTTVFSQIKAGFTGGSGYWNGTDGIVSTKAASDTKFLTTVGYRQSDGTTFDTYNPATSDVLVKYTYYGDATLDGIIGGDDYQQIDNGYGMGLTGWSNGDFNYDGVVNGSDFALIDNTFNQISATGATSLALLASPSTLIVSPAASVSAVPEPASLTLLTIGAATLLGKRRRHS